LDLRFHRGIHPHQRELPDVKTLVFLSAALMTLAQPPADTPKDVVDLFRTAVEALADKDSAAFLDKFDRNMPSYNSLRDEILALLDHSEVGSDVEIASDEGDAQKRALQLDWLLRIDNDQPRRQIIKCRIERQGKRWKITSIEPVEFFQPPA
jgi:hypothetical protein